jgi:hypothetical protein
MPVIDIRALPQASDADVPAALSNACLAVAAAAGIKPTAVFATWTTINPGCFVEGGKPADIQPKATHPPIVTLTAFEGRTPEMVEKMIMGAVNALTTHLKLAPGNVFLTYTEAKSGMIHTGGQIKRR